MGSPEHVLFFRLCYHESFSNSRPVAKMTINLSTMETKVAEKRTSLFPLNYSNILWEPPVWSSLSCLPIPRQIIIFRVIEYSGPVPTSGTEKWDGGVWPHPTYWENRGLIPQIGVNNKKGKPMKPASTTAWGSLIKSAQMDKLKTATKNKKKVVRWCFKDTESYHVWKQEEETWNYLEKL